MPSQFGTADVGSALNWMFAKFQEHLVPFLSLSGVIAAVSIIGGLLSNALIDSGGDSLEFDPTTGTYESTSTFFGGLIGGLILSLVIGLIVVVLRVGLLRAALRTSSGATPSFSDLTSGDNLGKYILVAIVVGILTVIGLVLCILPGLLVAFFMLFAPTHALDKGVDIGDAMSWSFNAVKANVVPCLLLVLITILASIVASLFGGAGGVLVAALIGLFLDPLGALLNANIYRQMGNEPIAA